MKTRFLKILTVGLVLAFGSASVSAAPINAPVPDDLYISFGGFDWAWAGPCAPVEPSCGVADLSYQGSLGWMIPTVDMLFPAASDFLRDDGSLRCATPYFNSVYVHCDYDDGVLGGVYNHPDGAYAGNLAVEFWAVRVPEPATLALFGLGLAGIGFARRKKA